MPIPPKPPSLQVIAVTHQSADLSWEALHVKLAAALPPEEGRLKAEVQVQRLDQPSAEQAPWDTAYKGFDTKCTVTGLLDSQAYYIRFRFGAVSGWGDYSEPQPVRTARRPFNGEDLHRLVRLEKEQELRQVLETNEANLNAPDDKGFSPLMQAALAGNAAFCQILLDNGAEVDWCGENGKTALMLVSYRGILTSMKLLLDCGADRHCRDRKSSTALHYAVDGEKLHAMSLLLTHRREQPLTQDSDATPTTQQETDKQKLLEQEKQEQLRLHQQQQLLIQARDASGCTPLIRCAMLKNNGNPDVAKALLLAGANPDDADDQKQTALFYCCLHRHLRMAELLLENGANTGLANDKGVTPKAVADGQESGAMRIMLDRYATSSSSKLEPDGGSLPPGVSSAPHPH